MMNNWIVFSRLSIAVWRVVLLFCAKTAIRGFFYAFSAFYGANQKLSGVWGGVASPCKPVRSGKVCLACVWDWRLSLRVPSFLLSGGRYRFSRHSCWFLGSLSFLKTMLPFECGTACVRVCALLLDWFFQQCAKHLESSAKRPGFQGAGAPLAFIKFLRCRGFFPPSGFGVNLGG
jgi:hypothetical protein